MAERRAAHQLLDKPLVFDDPLAVRIIGARAEANLPEQPKNFVAARFRAYMAARSRFAEDELRAAVARGVRQYVVLGAGLDTFAYRNPFPELKVFEVDHPATQAWKRKRLAQVGIQVPSSMTFAPVDFERETFDVGLRRVGFNEGQPTFFSWLGVTMYLDNDIVYGTFRAIREMNEANGVDVRLCRAARDARLRRAPRAGRCEPAREEGRRAVSRILRAGRARREDARDGILAHRGSRAARRSTRATSAAAPTSCARARRSGA